MFWSKHFEKYKLFFSVILWNTNYFQTQLMLGFYCVLSFHFADFSLEYSAKRSLTLKPSDLANPPVAANGIMFSTGKSWIISSTSQWFRWFLMNLSLRKLCRQQHTIIIKSTVSGFTLIGVKTIHDTKCVFWHSSHFTQMVVESPFHWVFDCLPFTITFHQVLIYRGFLLYTSRCV